MEIPDKHIENEALLYQSKKIKEISVCFGRIKRGVVIEKNKNRWRWLRHKKTFAIKGLISS